MTENGPFTERAVAIPAVGLRLPGLLSIPEEAKAVVVFAHGSGSGRLSPRNKVVAELLQAAGLGTLLFDLLTEKEAEDRTLVFDIELLAGRLQQATEWLAGEDGESQFPICYFGASTGAAGAIQAAASGKTPIRAVVSRGGRPDLASGYLPLLDSPTLLIVGERDEAVIELNRQALSLLRCEKQLVIVPGATHLFEEPGALDQVAALAREWFVAHLME